MATLPIIKKVRKIHSTYANIGRRFSQLIFEPVFIVVTIFVNACVVVASISLYVMEKGSNPTIHTYLDTVYWAVATVSTVGFGDVVPHSQGGRMMAIILMMIGTVGTITYTALFANALIAPEVQVMGSKLKAIDTEFKEFEEHVAKEESDVLALLEKVRALTNAVENRISRNPK